MRTFAVPIHTIHVNEAERYGTEAVKGVQPFGEERPGDGVPVLPRADPGDRSENLLGSRHGELHHGHPSRGGHGSFG